MIALPPVFGYTGKSIHTVSNSGRLEHLLPTSPNLFISYTRVTLGIVKEYRTGTCIMKPCMYKHIEVRIPGTTSTSTQGYEY
eukprot:SAG11_NODE_1008_length_6205_cov_3.939240_11_plen_82_part_00